jgi:hypothetical protein
MTKSKHNKNKQQKRICDVCGCDVIYNVGIYEMTGLCGTCATGESRLNYEED